MFKKILAISLTFLIALFISSTVFANSENIMENGKNAINNIMHDAQNMVTNATDGIKDATGSFENSANNMTNDLKDNENIDDNMNNRNTTAIPGDTSGLDDYSATRTTTTNITNNSFSIMWIILAVAVLVIVAALWFYGTQNNIDNNRH